MSDPTHWPRTEMGRRLLAQMDNRDGKTAATIVAIEDEAAALSTTPAPLDVERLARAMEAAVAGNQSDMETKGYDELAERFAREYAKP